MSTSAGDEHIEATIVRYDNQADVCTLHPANPAPEKQTTEWITAEEDGYVYLHEWR